ncbi:hypothetical protein [Ferruginibacter sp. SUN106]|uniref:hypothetical protein n=1 Tax=Ferruginibacter sp. SUN106 TaxID=2978348 RepID=UPI003D35DB01
MPVFKNNLSCLLAALISIGLFAACHNYYKAVPTPATNSNEKAATVDSLKLQSRYFVLRNGSLSYLMNNIVISEDKKSLTCNLQTLPENHQLHLVKGRRGKMQYNKSNTNDLTVLNEVHFYIASNEATATGNYTLQLDKVEKIEVIEKDKKRTTSSYVIGALGYTAGGLAIAFIIAAALKSSCPFVSAYDGNDFTLQGEIYGGAIYPQLARHDYMPLKMAPLQDGSLQLKISNELHEHQYTDMAELWVITHDKNSKVFADEKGNLFTVTYPQAPVTASLNTKADVTGALQNAGDNALLHMDDTAANATNEVIMQFNKPAGAKKAKLLLSLKNSYFLDLLYGELAKGFGNYYGTYIKQQQKKPVAELLQWTKEQKIPLEVSVKTTTGWKIITDITTIGPLATRNIVVPVELPESAENFTAIKLSSGFMFWEIDYAAIDYSQENTFSVQKITAQKATDELGKNVLPDLQKEDAVYLAQPDIGNTATLTYTATPLNDAAKTRTYILHTKGYYEHVRDFKNKPNISFLNQFKKPNAFPLFGMQLYKKINIENMKTLAKSN